MNEAPSLTRTMLTARALLLGDRIDTIGLERSDMLSTQPLAFRTGSGGIVTLYRYGVAVLMGMSALEEDEVIRQLEGRIVRPTKRREEESTRVEIAPDKDEQILPGGTVVLKTLTNEHALLVADALATSVILAHDERNVAAVFDVIEPFARQLAERGRTPGGRRAILKLIGNALLAIAQVTLLAAVALIGLSQTKWSAFVGTVAGASGTYLSSSTIDGSDSISNTPPVDHALVARRRRFGRTPSTGPSPSTSSTSISAAGSPGLPRPGRRPRSRRDRTR